MYYIYIDYTDNFIPFYVGIGTKFRIKQNKRNRKHTFISNKYGFNRKIIKVKSQEYACKLEIELIKYLKLNYCKNKDNHFACNFTDGGEGTVGCKASKETKEKMSKFRKGKCRSEEIKKKISNSHKGKILTEDHKKNISKNKIGKKLKISEENRKKKSERSKNNKYRSGKKHSEETKAKMSESSKIKNARYLLQEPLTPYNYAKFPQRADK
jgi:hypothetical protein